MLTENDLIRLEGLFFAFCEEENRRDPDADRVHLDLDELLENLFHDPDAERNLSKANRELLGRACAAMETDLDTLKQWNSQYPSLFK